MDAQSARSDSASTSRSQFFSLADIGEEIGVDENRQHHAQQHQRPKQRRIREERAHHR